jgi:hypothetical protein
MAKRILIANGYRVPNGTDEVQEFIDTCSDFQLGVVLRHVIREVGNRNLHVDLASQNVREGDAARGLRRLVPIMAGELARC